MHPYVHRSIITIVKTWKQPKCPLTGMNKEYVVHNTIDYHSAVKKNEIMPFSATWMDLESIILSEVRKRMTNTI